MTSGRRSRTIDVITTRLATTSSASVAGGSVVGAEPRRVLYASWRRVVVGSPAAGAPADRLLGGSVDAVCLDDGAFNSFDASVFSSPRHEQEDHDHGEHRGDDPCHRGRAAPRCRLVRHRGGIPAGHRSGAVRLKEELEAEVKVSHESAGGDPAVRCDRRWPDDLLEAGESPDARAGRSLPSDPTANRRVARSRVGRPYQALLIRFR